MAKLKTAYQCTACGYTASKWMGKCPGCDEWNTLEEVMEAPAALTRASRLAPAQGNAPERMRDIPKEDQARAPSGVQELDRVLGGGLVEGSLVLVGGEPGVGKSTLLMQVGAALSETRRVLYVTGEESARQLKLRAARLGAGLSDMHVLAETAMDAVMSHVTAFAPDCLIVDSIQTMYRPDMQSAPGSVSQVRECAGMYMRYAKESGCAVFLVGHVTKEGAIAGPRVLEHMVDVVLAFEGDRQREYRMLRAIKNRYGSINELGLFEMTGTGMRAVENPSETLLQHRLKGASGSVIYAALEGSRTMLVDLQALTAQSYAAAPRRTVDGVDAARVILLLAVMEKRAGLRLYNQDVFINVAGGMRLTEPACDLAVCAAVRSSLTGEPVPPDMAILGEVGLTGEVRAVPQFERRLSECARLGITRVICPRENARQADVPGGVALLPAQTLREALEYAGGAQAG